MNFEEAKKVLDANGQGHVLRFWDQLDEAARASLLDQVATIDFADVKMLAGKLAARGEGAAVSAAADAAPMNPAPVLELTAADKLALSKIGEAELKAGRVAAVVVAGGQGSRLGFEGPKGCYPVGPVSDAPLFHFHARKLLALANRWGKPVPFYVMTSRTNDAATRAFFEENNYFGLSKDDVFFFTQGMWPALSPDGKIILDAKDHIFFGPDGHGGMLAAMERSGALADMKRRGIETMFYFQVDNPMVDLCDPAFIGYHVRSASDYSIKVCAKRDPQEGLGVVVEQGGRTGIVEYINFSEEQKNERTSDGQLRFKYGSVAIHIFSVDFLAREAHAGLPINIAHKKVPFVDDTGATVKPSSPNAYKFEKFIFDALADARRSVCLAFSREDEFSPVKNADGADSPATCRADLSRKWARWLIEAGAAVELDASGYPKAKIEIDPVWADCSDAVKQNIAAGKISLDAINAAVASASAIFR